MDIISHFEETTEQEKFKIIIAGTVIFGIFRHNIVFALLLNTIIFFIYYFRIEEDKREDEEIKEIIKPMRENIENNRNIYDIIYNLQELYYDNPQSYKHMVNEIDQFIENYNEIKLSTEVQNMGLSILKNQRSEIMNTIDSIRLTSNEEERIVNGLTEIEIELNKMIKDIYERQDYVIITEGYTRHTKLNDKEIKVKDSNYFGTDIFNYNNF